MNYNTLGKTELKVSKLGYGCAPLGNEYGDIGEAEAIRPIHEAIAAGINFFDTSPYYGRTLSEARLGKALKGKRDQVILATKGGRFDAELETGFDFSYDSIMRMCDESLARLQTDWIDVYQLHDIEFGRKETVLEGIRALHDLKQQGKVRFIGVTGFPTALLSETIEANDLDVTLSYCHGNLLNGRMDSDLAPIVKAKNMGLINASVTHMGILTPQGEQPWHPAPDTVKKAGRAAAQLCDERGENLAELAIQYALQNEYADVTLLGTRDSAELNSSLKLLAKPINHQLLTDVQALIAPIYNTEWPSGFH